MKLEPQNVTRQVQNSLSDTLFIPNIQLIIPEEQVNQTADKIKIFKKDKTTHNSEELF